MAKIKILLADDHAVVRKGMKMLLEDEHNLEVIGEAENGVDALEKIALLLPNVVIMDLTMPTMGGIEATRHITMKYPAIKVLIFSMHNDSEYILKSLNNGASGYLLKDSSKEEILSALVAVAAGKKYFPPSISAMIIDELLAKTKNLDTRAKLENNDFYNILTKKESQIMKLILEGKNSREIADILKLSIRTVDNHRASMMKKANAKNTVELVNKVRGN
jgi:DNA-binding NarL/FixJ family response regulator